MDSVTGKRNALHPARGPAAAGQIHPRTNRDGLTSFHIQTCQLMEWLLHRCQYVFQIRTRGALKADLAHTIAVLGCGNDVVRVFCPVGVVAVLNDEGQGGPDIQRVPRGCSGCANELQVQAVLVIQNRDFSNVDARAPVSAMTLSSFLLFSRF